MQSWDTSAVGGREQFAYWREVICEAFGALDPHPAPDEVGAFTGRVRLASLGPVTCASVVAPTHVVVRDHAEIRRDPQDAVFVNLQLAGTCVISQAGREAIIRPGDLVVLDLTSPYAIEVGADFSILCFRLPRARLLPFVADPRRLPGRVALRERAATRIAGTMMGALWSNLPEVAEEPAARLTDALAEILGVALSGGPAPPDPGPAATLVRAKILIRRHLADPRLSPAILARMLHVSVRTLHAVFRTSGHSVAGSIREARLARCADDLANPADTRTIAEIGWRWGFGDPAHFSRTFSAAYDTTPGAYRANRREAQRVL